MSGFIDFTEAHVKRVERVTFRVEVSGSSLQELGDKAQRRGEQFYGSHQFRILSLDVYEPAPEWVETVKVSPAFKATAHMEII